jgi:hypothetical protein
MADSATKNTFARIKKLAKIGALLRSLLCTALMPAGFSIRILLFG